MTAVPFSAKDWEAAYERMKKDRDHYRAALELIAAGTTAEACCARQALATTDKGDE